jgi:hypothetical protein
VFSFFSFVSSKVWRLFEKTNYQIFSNLRPKNRKTFQNILSPSGRKFAKNKIPYHKQFFFFFFSVLRFRKFCDFFFFGVDFKPKISKNNFAKNKIPDYKWEREGGEESKKNRKLFFFFFLFFVLFCFRGGGGEGVATFMSTG